MINRQITLASRPQGFPKATDFSLVESPVSHPDDGEFLVAGRFLSVDPYMRGRMNDAPSYAEPVQIGEVMVGGVVGEVIESQNPRFQVGDHVCGMFGWQEYAISNGEGVQKVDPQAAPISTSLHALGMPGLTAYFGLTEVCRIQSGETVVISGAAGAVGSVAGQIAGIKGCRVVGIAGSDEKVNYLTEQLGYDAAFNYKTTEDYTAQLRALCPRGVDAYFDNVGGPITDAVFPLLNLNARVAICGQISQYNAEEAPLGPRLLWHLIVKRATVRRFLVLDFYRQYAEAIAQLTAWWQSGELVCPERIVDGIENAPRAFFEMMQGANIGKQLVKL